jgi:HD-GYP domain-containing protein (c-di-GMP phosphodiesterase class II)
LPESEALAVMLEQQGAQFDSALLTTFFTILDEIHELAHLNPDASIIHPEIAGSILNVPIEFAPPVTTTVTL